MGSVAAASAELVLVGGGHAHVHVLKAFGMRPLPGLRVTLVSREAETPYSGMLPGLVAGACTIDQAHIDLRRMAGRTGVRFVQAAITGIDRANRRVLFADRPPLPYTLLSLNTGAEPPLAGIPGAVDHAIPVKPVNRFLAGWARFAGMERSAPPHVVVVGGGAAGVELALALRARMAADGMGTPPVTLVARGRALDGFPEGARRRLLAALARHCITLLDGAAVTAVRDGAVRLDDGRWIGCDVTVWATGVGAPDWLARTGLPLDPQGFVAVDATLRSIDDPAIFAAGDIAAMRGQPRQKAGVFAVRQGPPLAANLRRALLGKPLRPFRPQRDFLRLVGTGDGRAVAARGPLAAEGAWVWAWKQRIDRRWMDRVRQAGAGMGGAPVAPAAAAMRCAGCGAKLAGPVLAGALARLGIDPAAGDDAALLEIAGPGPLLQTVDLFRAPIDDPWLLGRIAALHALGDIQAMGGRPLSALAIVGLPHGPAARQEEDLYQMLAGARLELGRAGADLIGGHSAELEETALGFAVTGTLDGRPPLRKGGLRPGDRLILTRPLGSGVLLAGAMRGAVRGRFVTGALEAMLAGNRRAADILRTRGATACTDVTGFGLAGHLAEMLRASACAARLDPAALPLLPGALAAAAAGIASTLAPANRDLAPVAGGDPADPRHALLFDPQTAGGLLAGVPADRAGACLAALHAAGCTDAAVIGSVHPPSGGGPAIHLRTGSAGTDPHAGG